MERSGTAANLGKRAAGIEAGRSFPQTTRAKENTSVFTGCMVGPAGSLAREEEGSRLCLQGPAAPTMTPA